MQPKEHNQPRYNHPMVWRKTGKNPVVNFCKGSDGDVRIWTESSAMALCACTVQILPKTAHRLVRHRTA